MMRRKARSGWNPDPRYGRARWKKARLFVLHRDGYVCQVVKGCPNRATIADHIVPVTPSTTERQFHDLSNLRAACRTCNLGRPSRERLQRGERLRYNHRNNGKIRNRFEGRSFKEAPKLYTTPDGARGSHDRG